MPGLGAGHWGYIVILLVIVLIIWGPGKLPDIGSGLGRGIREFRKATSETRDEFTKATRGEDTACSRRPGRFDAGRGSSHSRAGCPARARGWRHPERGARRARRRRGRSHYRRLT